ncbi:hypothetical protein GCM10027569_36830 [Flindersiella endophytica]
MVIGALLTLLSFFLTDDQVNDKAAVPDYDVQFGVPGDWCPSDLSTALAIDERNGMPLVCSDTPILYADPEPYPFTSAEATANLGSAGWLFIAAAGLFAIGVLMVIAPWKRVIP